VSGNSGEIKRAFNGTPLPRNYGKSFFSLARCIKKGEFAQKKETEVMLIQFKGRSKGVTLT
jgi:hypothetical protein